jgi:hypothetical protein
MLLIIMPFYAAIVANQEYSDGTPSAFKDLVQKSAIYMNKPEFRASDVQFGLRLSYCKKIFTDPFDYFIPSDGSEV